MAISKEKDSDESEQEWMGERMQVFSVNDKKKQFELLWIHHRYKYIGY